jgi:pyruvate formate lyase activating enzyme
MKEAILFEKLEGSDVKCKVCQMYCIIQDGKRGFCGTRLNKGGTLYTLIYGLASSICVDPIEKKPLYHFYPGSLCLSLGALGCNFKCPGCQNWHISHDEPDEACKKMTKITPEESITVAENNNCSGISWTYNEPAIWHEHTLESAKIARERKLYTVYVTNGYISQEALDMIGPYLDGYRVDIKGFSKTTYKNISGIARYEDILEMAKRAKFHWKMHVECITNVTPTINDSDKEIRDIASWIKTELGEFTPWHITRFYPHLDLSHLPPTPIKKLEHAYEIGKEEGLKYVYMGNVPGHKWEDTYCHNCGKCIIERSGFTISNANLKDGKCPFCGAEIPGRWQGSVNP